MYDFLKIKHRTTSKGDIEVYPDFLIRKSEDLMVRGGAFYAIWNHNTNLWCTDEYVVQLLIDHELYEYAKELEKTHKKNIYVKTLSDYSSGCWITFKNYILKLSDNFKILNSNITFSNTEKKKELNASKTLPYSIQKGDTSAFLELFNFLYEPKELEKIMWVIGSIISGESKNIQKFFVLFGPPGTGKSTVLNLIEKMFVGYISAFEAQTLTGTQSNFATEIFRENPLVAINHEGDLSGIKNNSLLNSIVSHDEIIMNIKHQRAFPIKLNTILLIATNKPVLITDGSSGILRRLIDIRPTGNILDYSKYESLTNQISFELGAIAELCLSFFKKKGKNFYDKYRPTDMLLMTNVIYNFVDEFFFEFFKDNKITLSKAWELYKNFCEGTNVTNRLAKYQFRDEFKHYWNDFHPYKRLTGDIQYRSLYENFRYELFAQENTKSPVQEIKKEEDWLVLRKQQSELEVYLSANKAQYASIKDGLPKLKWENVKDSLKDIDSTKLHYVLPPSNHVVIDFDLKDDSGNKSLELNIEAAKKFPPTYAELSKSGLGLHLHYEYHGDLTQLSKVFSEGIEILSAKGNFSIRRKLSLCNNSKITVISSGLPLKEISKVTSSLTIETEKSLRTLIKRNIRKEIHPATKPSMDFIAHILSEAKAGNLAYDISDMKREIVNFASKSTNNAQYCLNLALQLPYSNEIWEESYGYANIKSPNNLSKLTFFDVEVYSNVLLVCWKYEGKENKCHRMYNPSPEDIDVLMSHKLVGFNNRRYDNHILYARRLGYTTEELYILSSRIIKNDRSVFIKDAYGVSYTDVYDYSSKKQSLKKWQLDLNIHHKEVPFDWSLPLPEDKWEELGEYCDNDVYSLEEVHNHLTEDYNARLILSKLSGLTPNDSTQSHTARIIFGNEKNPQKEFVYTDLSEQFEGYKFGYLDVSLEDSEFEEEKPKKVRPVSTYNGEVVGEGGYVYSDPGVYEDVFCLDIASMHPTSIKELNLFGKYTKNYVELMEARLALKRGDIKKAETMFGGKLKEILKESKDTKGLAYSLKIVINIVYGLTSASFPNPFRDIRNVDNIVAKRGALFMLDLKKALLERGVNLVHIKTDSVKISKPEKEDLDFIISFGKKYGYTFETESIYSVLILLNDSDYIGKYALQDKRWNLWEAVGSRFSKPYVFKKLFSKENIQFEDLVEKRSVSQGVMYLKHDNGNSLFVGKSGSFCPVIEGADLIRVKDEKEYHVTDTKNHKWVQSENIKDLNYSELVDYTYFDNAVHEAEILIYKLKNSENLIY